MTNFFLEQGLPEQEIKFLLATWGKHGNHAINFVHDSAGAITVGRQHDSMLRISSHFGSRNLRNADLNSDGYIAGDSGERDYLTTAFYLLNSQQEFNDTDPDELGRFRYKNSYQFKFQNCTDNIVQQCFNEMSQVCGVPVPHEKSSFFLSHDIDSVHGAILEDGFNVIKKGRIDLFLKMLVNVAVRKPDWLNMDKIMALESTYDCKSVFYWIVNQGRINKREKNADYAFKSTNIQKKFQMVRDRGFENGIHKSISAETLRKEIEKFGETPLGNRYHYLKFRLPQMYGEVERAGIPLDASVGFAEEIGFRNSYGLPFNPFDFEKRRPYSFVEVPLHVMDRTFYQYKKCSVEDARNEIIGFFEKNRENCVLSVLWHNNFFTDYKFKGYLALYKHILDYMKENRFRTISQEEIIKKYSII